MSTRVEAEATARRVIAEHEKMPPGAYVSPDALRLSRAFLAALADLNECNAEVLRQQDLWTEQSRVIRRQVTERETLVEALGDAIFAAEYLAEQQAMPDDGYEARLAKARAVRAEVV